MNEHESNQARPQWQIETKKGSLLESMPQWVVSLAALGLLGLFIPAVYLVCQTYLQGTRGWQITVALGLAISLFLEGVVAAFLSSRMAARGKRALTMWVLVIFVVLGISGGIGGLPILLSKLSPEGEDASPPTPTTTPTLAEEAPVPTEEAPATPTAIPTPEATPTPVVITYTVQTGDTLSAIAANFGVTVEELVRANDIADSSRIQVGQVLVIPAR